MISHRDFVAALKLCGVDVALTLPCSSFSGVLASLAEDPRFDHVGVTSEAEAVGIAAGVWLAGRTPAVLIQSSGFCDALNPIGSLLETFSIPVLFFVSVRGGFGKADEPQHDLIGRQFMAIVASFQLESMVLDAGQPVLDQLRRFHAHTIERGRTGIVAVPTGTIETRTREPAESHKVADVSEGTGTVVVTRLESAGSRHCGARAEVLAAIREAAPSGALLICSTGYIGRDLYMLGDAPNQLYVAGSMGCASAIGFGISRYVDRPVIILDGDGAALMRMGNFATIANARPGHLIHVVLNNGNYESTGGQCNYARNVDLAAVARACGYSPGSTRVASLERLKGLVASMGGPRSDPRPVLIDALIAPRSPAPTVRPVVTPPQQAMRMRQVLTSIGQPELAAVLA